MNYKNVFLKWYEDCFKSSEMYIAMTDTVEDSPYHREANVATHTDMVVCEYIKLSPYTWSKKDFLGAVVCAMHDVGKPLSEEVVERSDGTKYRRYSNHELWSQRIYMEYILSCDGSELREYLDDSDIYNIGYMIQYHLPYQLGKDRTAWLQTHLSHYGIVDIFIRCISADAMGRISDDTEATLLRLTTWVNDNLLLLDYHRHNTIHTDKELVVMVGVTGVGKSTYVEAQFPSHKVHSMDALRLEWYSSDYNQAFKLSCDDNEFSTKVMKDFRNTISNNDKVVVDNTNLKVKDRRRFITNTKHRTKAVVFLTTYQKNLSQLLVRKDKHIGKFVLDRMFWNLTLPSLGEFDDIVIVVSPD